MDINYKLSRLSLLCIPLLFLITACTSPTTQSITPLPAYPCDLPGPRSDNSIAFPTSIPSDADVYENAGQVCFYPLTSNQFRAVISSPGCYSSSCSLIFERTGDMSIDPDEYSIQFSSRFAVKGVGSEWASGIFCACTADCGGAGYIEFTTGEMREGVYRVRLGTLKIGDLIVPSAFNNECFSTEATAIPYSTPVPTSTRDPKAYPEPLEPTRTPTPYIYP